MANVKVSYNYRNTEGCSFKYKAIMHSVHGRVKLGHVRSRDRIWAEGARVLNEFCPLKKPRMGIERLGAEDA